MTRPFQRNCAHVFVLSMLLQLFVSHCCPEFARNTASNAVANGHVVENRSGKLDPSIERIFRGTSERRVDVTSSKRNVESKAVQHEDGDKRVRLKRDSAVRGQPGNRRRSNEREEAARKRSVSDRGGKGSLRIGRSSKDLPKLPDKDYGVPVDREKSEYTDEAEDDSASGNKKARYLGARVQHS